ncbi:extensin family protein [Novosphingobium bradum]|uniref:Extensin family protein n=1 Tax=Novosphingobium bradum TaxID=1737444 RepID=A0ABV7IPJ5_9SPHN
MRRSFARLPLIAATVVAATLLAGCGAMVPQQESRRPIQRSTQLYSPRPEAGACLSSLGRANAAFTPLPDQYFGAGCSTLNAVRLVSLRGDRTSLGVSNLGPVACPLAETFAGWARFGVDRAARQILGSALVRIETMGSYSCRTVAGSDRMSAHATARAIDVGGFVLADGRRITVLNDWNSPDPQVRAFLATVQQSACKRFGTVLGPAYNAAHRDHLHVDLGGGRGFCR